MWCSTCGKDLPVLPTADDPEAFTCIGCRQTSVHFASEITRWDTAHLRVEREADSEHLDDVCPVEPPPVFDADFEWHDAHVRPTLADRESSLQPAIKTDLPPKNQGKRRRLRTCSSFTCWSLLTLGVALFACGGALIAYSLTGDRDELWNLGAPMALAGQAIFLIGLVLQLDIIWHQSRQTSRNLFHLDDRLAQLQDERELVEGSDLQPSPIARQNGAESRNPQVLFKDLKGQLDTLSEKIASKSPQ
ncbi:MAG: hypothetical protein P8N76_00240 [Pirellulaceae bacterium]|nr:hypothetical protein [Pirellulaceae bacterium]